MSEVPGGELGGLTVASVQDELLHFICPSDVGRRVHAVIVPCSRLGRIGQTMYSSGPRAWVIHPIGLAIVRRVCVVRLMRR